jgi:hypothetical protein
MFGGEGIDAKLGDLWAFDTQEEVWAPKMMSGDSPAPRSGYSVCAVGDLMYLYGGEGDLYLYQDFYVFDASKSTWRVITDVVWPPARKHASLVCDYPLFYLLGGITINGYVSEVWKIDMLALTVELLSEDPGLGPKPFAFSNCFGEYEEDSYMIYISYGESFGHWPLDSTYKYDVALDQWEVVASPREMSRAAVVKLNDRLILAGGENWGLYSFDTVYELNLESDEETYLGQLTHKPYSAAFTYYGSTLYIHGGGGDSLGSKFRFFVPIPHFIKIQMNENCSDCSWPCSQGTFLNAVGLCEPCAEGTYNSELGAVQCTECPKGTASRQLGNSSKSQCRTCPQGSFTADDGSSLCLDCPKGYECEVGSSKPSMQGVQDSRIESQQPDIFSVDTSQLKPISSNTQLGVIVLCVSAVVLYMTKHSRVIPAYQTIDIFAKAHNHFVGEAMFIRKTALGGLFSVLFMLLAAMFLSASFATFILDNIVETKALVPLVALEKSYPEFTSNLNITAEFGNFHGPCADDQFQCSSNIIASTENIIGEPELSCYEFNKRCSVTFTCNNCQVSAGAKTSYLVQSVESFSSSITVNVTCSSSIPNEISSIEQFIKANTDYVFRGQTATKIYFEMTPSVRTKQIFTSEDSAWPASATGYHVAAVKSPDRGTEVLISE